MKTQTAKILAATCLALLVGCSLQPPLKTLEDKSIEVTGGGISIKLHSLSARITSMVHEASGEQLLRPWPDQDRRATFSISMRDGLTGRTVSPLTDSTLVLDYRENDGAVEFDQLLLPDGYRINKKVSGGRDGVYLDYEVRLDDEDAPLRSLDFTFMLPIQRGSRIWVPGCESDDEQEFRGRRRYVYGPGAGGDYSMSIPLISFRRKDGPAFSLAVPLELPVVRVVFEIEPSVVPHGVSPRLEECDWLKVTFDLVGASGVRSLHAGLWLYAHEPDWRDALRIFAEKHREYFEAPRRIRSAEAPLAGLGTDLPPLWRLAQIQKDGTGAVRLAWNVFRSGEWVPPQARRFEDFTWQSRQDSSLGEVSVSRVRSVIDHLVQFKLRAVLDAAWNSSCGKYTAESSYGEDIAENERGDPIVAGDGRLMMYAAPESPFGKAMLEQQRQMLELYPQALGYYFPDWSATGIDFAHDDSLTVAHNRPAADLGANRVRVGERLIALVNEQRKLTITAMPGRVVESKGVDMLCFSATRPEQLRQAALLGIWRPVISDPGDALRELSLVELEELLKEKLLQGVIPSHAELRRDQALGRAYRPLFQLLAARQWRLDPIRIGLPPGVRSQVFQRSASRSGVEQYLLLCLARPGVLLADESRRMSMKVTLAFTGAAVYNRALWQSVSRTPRGVPLRVVSSGEDSLEVTLPPFGAAGVLRLSTQ